MFRSMTALLAVSVLVAAAPAHRQPTASSAPSAKTEFDPVAAAQANEASLDKTRKANEARDKEWDRKMKGTMSSICRGC